MGLLIAPYNNAMRLGQGFNSYTQEICIDDAVIADPGRPENALTNDGTTMTDLRAAMKGPSAYSAIRERSVLDQDLIEAHKGGDEAHDPDPPLESDLEESEDEAERAPKPKPKKIESKQDDDSQDEAETENEEEENEEDGADKKDEEEEDDEKEDEGEDENDVKHEAKEDASDNDDDAQEDEEDRNKVTKKVTTLKPKPAPITTKKPTKEERLKARKDAAEKKKQEHDEELRAAKREEAEKQEEKRRAASEKRAREAANGIKPYTKAERDAMLGKQGKDTVVSAMDGLKARKTREYTYKATGARGPSQIVTYTSSFIEKLSDITDDMSISGALSIKYGAIGGSGRGAFVNSDKFKDSDLNFYISVKVVNQTINMRDSLVYQPLRSVDSADFRKVYGDSFISGFIEGGEFNAVVSMKVHNKAQITQIEAEAKVALTAGMAEVSAEAAVKVAKKNITNNTETTIQVSWSGGGFIKPMDEPWDIESLMSAAARFPDLVAVTPQRTYAILTKYETLRSFVKLKPAAFTPMAYENAQLYTNTLMDTYMDYKTIQKKLSSWIFDIENGISRIDVNPTWKKNSKSSSDKSGKSGRVPENKTSQSQDESPFPATAGGLDQARRACRFQMARIVNEVDAITNDPSLAALEWREEPFQPPRVFKDRLPLVTRIIASPSVPLRLEEIQPGASRGPELCSNLDELEDAERLALTDTERDRPTAGRFFRLTKPVGSAKNGTLFNNLDFLKFDMLLSSVKVGLYKGVVTYIETAYTNGLVWRRGGQYNQIESKYVELHGLGERERIIACTIETGEEMKPGEPDVKPVAQKGDKLDTTTSAEPRITRLKLYTNRGRLLAAEEDAVIDDDDIPSIANRKNRRFKNLKVTHYDPVMENSYIKGFWGFSHDGPFGRIEDGIWRLGVIWGNNLKPEVPSEPTSTEKKGSKDGEAGGAKKGKTT